MPITRPQQSRGLIEPHAPDRLFGADPREAVAHWQSLVDRGLIGAGPAMTPAVRASVLAAEAAILGGRRGGGAGVRA